MTCGDWGIFLSILGGGIITIATAIFIEVLRKPKLVLGIEKPELDVPRDSPQRRHLRLTLRNEPAPFGLQWMLQRAAALQCRGEITFHNLDGQNIFDKTMAGRWASSPEPIRAAIQTVDSAGNVQTRAVAFADPDSRIDVYPGEEEKLDVTVRFAGEQDCYGWNNEAYLNNWRTPDWKLPRGAYLVKAVVTSSGNKCVGEFRLLNEVDALTAFRLTPLLPEDQRKIR